jgi:hypothetical protein
MLQPTLTAMAAASTGHPPWWLLSETSGDSSLRPDSNAFSLRPHPRAATDLTYSTEKAKRWPRT